MYMSEKWDLILAPTHSIWSLIINRVNFRSNTGYFYSGIRLEIQLI